MKNQVKRSLILIKHGSIKVGERDLTEILRNPHNCDECGSRSIVDMRTGTEVCRNCGLVLKNKLHDDRQDFFDVYFNNPNVNSFPTSHTLKDPALHRQFQLKSVQDINYGTNFHRLIKLQKRSNFQKGTNPNFFRGLKEIKMICANLNLSNQLEEEAALIFRKVNKAKIIRGRSIKKICMACIYLAHKCRNVQPPLDELLASHQDCSKKEIFRLSKFISEKINVKTINAEPPDYLLQFIHNGNLPKALFGESLKILESVKEMNEFQGKNPQSLTAAALYLSSKKLKLKISQEMIAKATNLSRKTINLRVNEMKKALNFL